MKVIFTIYLPLVTSIIRVSIVYLLNIRVVRENVGGFHWFCDLHCL